MNRAKPNRQTSRQRWDRITEIHRQLDVIGGRSSKTGRKDGVGSPEWEQLCVELRSLTDMESDAAWRQKWPVWQRGQHFEYLPRVGPRRAGEVIRFDLAACTVVADTWTLDDFLGEMQVEGHIRTVTVTVAQIRAGEAQRDREEKKEDEAQAS